MNCCRVSGPRAQGILSTVAVMKKAIVVRALALDFLQEIDSFVKSKKQLLA